MTTISPLRSSSLLPALVLTPLLRWTIAAHSVPDDQPWRTTCPCGRPLWASASRPSGRCTGCSHRIGAPPYAVEATTGLVAVALVLNGRTGWELAAYLWWAATMTVLAFVDLAVMRLPHRITIASTAGFLGLVAATGDHHAWQRATIAGLVVAGFFATMAVVSRGHLGWGDAALGIPVAAALGWHSWATVYSGMLLGLGAAALTAVTLRRTGRLAAGAALPLGPFLITAASAVVVSPWS